MENASGLLMLRMRNALPYIIAMKCPQERAPLKNVYRSLRLVLSQQKQDTIKGEIFEQARDEKSLTFVW